MRKLAVLVISCLVSGTLLAATRRPAAHDPSRDGHHLLRTEWLFATLPDGTVLPFTVRLPAASSAPRPVALVIHGYACVGADYSWIADHLASRGFAAALIETRSPFEPDFETWADETIAQLDALNAANVDPGSGLFGELDLTLVGAIGHSYGGSTAIAAAARDARIGAVVALEPGAAGIYHSDLLARAGSLKVPLLVVGGELDPVCPPAAQGFPVFQAASSPRLYVEIARGDHLGLLDYYFAPPPYRFYADTHTIASRYLTAWLETELLGRADPDGWTDGRAAAQDYALGDLSRWSP